MSETARKKRPAAKQATPETVHIAWHNRPLTWGIGCLFLLLLVVSSLLGTGGPETGKAQEPAQVQEPEAEVEVEVVTEPTIDADNSSIVVVGGEGEIRLYLYGKPRQTQRGVEPSVESADTR